ncbi:unnamed protein product [Nippostrongylus brasiliensis]|uniref:EB domain-containing protein n=1 Tax=Nippostrongylus brasiliensis TaxID=27835 RepID=A0A0N4YF66_NIPBR|nr:unnamed protein product [Nippostrongylus brasiliensis]
MNTNMPSIDFVPRTLTLAVEVACSARKSMGEACIQSCGPPACQCRPGYVRRNGVCIDLKLCPESKPTSQSYVDEPITPASPSSDCAGATIQILCVTGFHCELSNGEPICVPDQSE